MQTQMRSKDKRGSLPRTAQKTNEGVEEKSPNDRLQEGFHVNMWSLEERRRAV